MSGDWRNSLLRDQSRSSDLMRLSKTVKTEIIRQKSKEEDKEKSLGEVEMVIERS